MSEYQDLKKSLQKLLGEQIEILPVTSKTVDLIAISSVFEAMGATEQRESYVREGLKEHGVEIRVGLMSLYTPEEAEALGVEIREVPVSGQPASWMELMKWSMQERKIEKESKGPKVVAFYSFKGGVGRTTALVHAAWAMAEKNKKVVIVDMDFEAPSLHQAVGKMRPQPKHGLVDYLYERTNMHDEGTPRISVSSILGEVDVKKGRLFVVPAGRVDADYITKVDDLRSLPFYDMKIWENFKAEIVKQVQPDLILVDSRTGINIWGALSLLTIADDSIFFFNPNAQNREGVTTILKSLKKVGISPLVVMSPVIHMGGVGGIVAKSEWEKIQAALEDKDLGSSVRKEILPGKQDNSIMIPFEADIALAEHYPHSPAALLHYQKIVEFLDDKLDQPRLIDVLGEADRREVLESLNFISLDVKNVPALIPELFQKPTGFERFIDPSTVIIRGRKGAGKTTLFGTALHDFNILCKYSPNELRRVHAVTGFSGHEQFDFEKIRGILKQNGLAWKHFWQAWALIQLRDTDLPISRVLKGIEDQQPIELVINLLENEAVGLKIEESLIEQKTSDNQEIYWLMYDDFEREIMELPFGREIVEGLLGFAKYLEETAIQNIGVKIFLQNTTWDKLDESVKSQFVGREMELMWAWEDLSRLVLRQAMRSEPFSRLAKQYAFISDVDTVTDDRIAEALDLLWGINRGPKWHVMVRKWLQGRLMDSTLFVSPKTLVGTLREAVRIEKFYLNEPNWPNDRLLSIASLHNGVEESAKELCQVLRDEFRDLDNLGFFDFASTLFDEFWSKELYIWWEMNAKLKYPNYDTFLGELQKTGMFFFINEAVWEFMPVHAYAFGAFYNRRHDENIQ